MGCWGCAGSWRRGCGAPVSKPDSAKKGCCFREDSLSRQSASITQAGAFSDQAHSSGSASGGCVATRSRLHQQVERLMGSNCSSLLAQAASTHSPAKNFSPLCWHIAAKSHYANIARSGSSGPLLSRLARAADCTSYRLNSSRRRKSRPMLDSAS